MFCFFPPEQNVGFMLGQCASDLEKVFPLYLVYGTELRAAAD